MFRERERFKCGILDRYIELEIDSEFGENVVLVFSGLNLVKDGIFQFLDYEAGYRFSVSFTISVEFLGFIRVSD